MQTLHGGLFTLNNILTEGKAGIADSKRVLVYEILFTLDLSSDGRH